MKLLLLYSFLVLGSGAGYCQYPIHEIAAAALAAKPGDKLSISPGKYADVPLLIHANGTKEKPIIIYAATPGSVQLTGNSFLKISGQYVQVEGLHFTNGATKNDAVIEFRNTNDKLANHCRVTNCVIDNYSKPERFETDSWIVFWGKNNRLDHCTIGDKLNGGTTVIVNLDDERSQNNYHSIDSNFFNGRQRLGSNGGETIRIGVSRYSLTASHTLVAYNYFEKVNGEVEIISVKSGNNHIYKNTFYECEGGVVLRHGSKNVVESNVFMGNNKPFTGGIRVINPGHRIHNNLLVECAGDRFRSAFGVLNGVPNSLINRYYQVKDAAIYNNSFINCKSLLFGAGKDAERTLSPQNVSFTNNYISTKQPVLFEDANKDGGIKFSNNTFNSNTDFAIRGFNKVRTHLIKWGDRTLPIPISNSGANLDSLVMMHAGNTGAQWYAPSMPKQGNAAHIVVTQKQAKDLPAIISKANDGDIIYLENSTLPYTLDREIIINKKIMLRAVDTLQHVEFVNVNERNLPAFITIENGGNLSVAGISFNGAYKSFGDVAAGIATIAKKPMNKHYNLTVRHCHFYNFNEGSMSGIKATKSTFADSVMIADCLFRNISGVAIDFSAEKEDKGIYNVEYFSVTNTVFSNLLATAIVVYRGGNDESTTGPAVSISHCVFNEVNNMEQGSVIKLLGVQQATVSKNIFHKSGQGGRSIWFEENSWDKLFIDDNNFYQAGRIQLFYNKAEGPHHYILTPAFVDAANYNFHLKAGSPLLYKAVGGTAIGLLR